MLRKSKVTILNFYKRVFESADVDSAIVIFEKNNSDESSIRLAEWEKEFSLIGEVDRKILLDAPDSIINVEALKNSDTFSLLEKIERGKPVLSEIAEVKSGLKAYEVGKGTPPQTKDMKDSRVYHSTSPKDKSIKYLEGKNVCRYHLGWSGEYLEYGVNLAAPRGNFDLFSTPRILVRQIPSPLPYCINACLTAEKLLNDLNSMNIIYIKVAPQYLLGLLNSRLISYWFAHKFGKLQRGIFPQFKVNELAQFPIVNIPSDKQKPIIKCVNTILSNKQSDPCADTSALEVEIDRMVYEIYGLTEEEIRIVEDCTR